MSILIGEKQFVRFSEAKFEQDDIIRICGKDNEVLVEGRFLGFPSYMSIPKIENLNGEKLPHFEELKEKVEVVIDKSRQYFSTIDTITLDTKDDYVVQVRTPEGNWMPKTAIHEDGSIHYMV